VGVGKIARDQHLPAITQNPRFELVATASPHGVLDGLAAYPDLAAMLAGGHDLDAVSLCTPPSIRAGIAEAALAAGLHVMLEKPPAATLAQVDAMRAAALRAGRSLFATWHSRETSAVDAARAWLAARRIRTVRVTWREDVRQWHPGQDWLLGADGFGVFDPAINALSILTTILPGTLTLDAAELYTPENRAAPMRAILAMRHDGAGPDGAGPDHAGPDHAGKVTCDFDILHSGDQQWDIDVQTDAGALTLSGGGHRLTIGGVARPQAANCEYARLYGRFADLIAQRDSDVDAGPLALVTDALTLGRNHPIAPFEF
jgi:D-galactose 1-dehydrogenase/L-arabinose 1- dehydrogenase